MAVITGISPESVFHFFEEISKVPRGSGNTEKMTEYLANFSFERNLAGGADDTGKKYERIIEGMKCYTAEQLERAL